MTETINPKLARAMSTAHAAQMSTWCGADKHASCKGRWFDADLEPHPCSCACHEANR